MLLFIGARLFHVFICFCSAYGVLFSKTPLQAYIVLSYLTVIFLGLRLFKGCMLTPLEDGVTTDIGREFLLEDPSVMTNYHFEEVVVGFSMLLQLIRTGLIIFNLHDVIF
jgi:hypothetical protein